MIISDSKNRKMADWCIAIEDFSAQMFSFLQVSETLIPEMVQRQESEIFAFMDLHRHLLSEDEYAEFSRAVEWFGGSLGKIFENRDGVAQRKEGGEVHEKADGEADGKSFSFRSANASSAFGQVIFDSIMGVKADPREDMLRKSLLVSAVSTFEVLFGRLAERVYRVNKSALNESEYKFSLQELAEFASMDDAREFLVERRIAALMRDSVDGWGRWLGKAVKGVSMEDLPIDWPSTREVFARRNLVVHNGGVVNRIYLSIINDLGGNGGEVKLGAKLKIDKQYFAEGVQGLLALGILLSADVAGKLHKREARELSSVLIRISDIAVRRKAWSVVEALSAYLLRGDLNRGVHLRAQLLSWTARRGKYGPDAIRGEVEEWDVSGLSEEFVHCKKVLIGESEEAVRLIEELLARQKLTLIDLATNPIYAEVASEVPSFIRAKELGSEDAPRADESASGE
ncbi:hypothetical protein [Streptomyces sp. NPDC059256]|uniref:hypothetical protein n=1 Tax=Streptomyces sp. NPDC059256 TaxID=3346794 RepID=UPI0036C7712F